MKDSFFDDPYLMDNVWYSPDNLMSRMTVDKIQWALCWGYIMETGEYPPRLLGTKEDVYSKGGFYRATWENNVSCIAWIRKLLDSEGVGGEMWLAHLDCPMFRRGMSIEELSKHYGYDVEIAKHLMNRAIHHAVKHHMNNKHLWKW